MSTLDARARVLVVDDERNMRSTLAEILEAEGYAVETAESGEAAVQRCSVNPFDIVLMDVRMPGSNGVEAFRRIREHNRGEMIGANAVSLTASETGQIMVQDAEFALRSFKTPADQAE